MSGYYTVTPKAKPMLYSMKMQPTLTEEIPAMQAMDPQSERIMEEVLLRKAPGFVIHEDGTLRFHN